MIRMNFVNKYIYDKTVSRRMGKMIFLIDKVYFWEKHKRYMFQDPYHRYYECDEENDDGTTGQVVEGQLVNEDSVSDEGEETTTAAHLPVCLPYLELYWIFCFRNWRRNVVVEDLRRMSNSFYLLLVMQVHLVD